MQLIADLFNCASLSSDHQALQTMVEDMPDTEQRPPEETGVTAHGAIHTDPESKTAWVEVFSVYEFDPIATVSYFMEQLQPSVVDYQVIDRGARIKAPRGTIPVVPWMRVAPPPAEASQEAP